MSAITISLADDKLDRLRALADKAGLSPEELARTSLEEWLSQPGGDFAAAAQYVFRKNAEHYRRLA